MKLQIIWSEFAEKQLDKIFEFYLELADEDTAKKLLYDLLSEPEKLVSNPLRGQTEPLLQKRIINYRYLIYRNFKIIYSVDLEKGFIKIADVFDTRQNPEKIGRSK